MAGKECDSQLSVYTEECESDYTISAFTIRWLLWNVRPLPVQNQVNSFVATLLLKQSFIFQSGLILGGKSALLSLYSSTVAIVRHWPVYNASLYSPSQALASIQ